MHALVLRSMLLATLYVLRDSCHVNDSSRQSEETLARAYVCALVRMHLTYCSSRRVPVSINSARHSSYLLFAILGGRNAVVRGLGCESKPRHRHHQCRRLLRCCLIRSVVTDKPAQLCMCAPNVDGSCSRGMPYFSPPERTKQLTQ